MTCAMVMAFRHWMPMWPSPPTPTTTADEPAPSAGIALLTAWKAVRPASASAASSAGSASASSLTIARALVLNSSAMPPARVRPGRSGPRAHRMSSPARQAPHTPQVRFGWQMTASPTARWSTAGPTAWIQPAFSCPRTSGSSDGMTSANQPSMICRSVRHSPAPPILTTTSSGPVTWGSGTSSSRGGCPYECTRIAFMDAPYPADGPASGLQPGIVRSAARVAAIPGRAVLTHAAGPFCSSTPRPRAAPMQMACTRRGTGLNGNSRRTLRPGAMSGRSSTWRERPGR
jgi:hypothetical protein